MPELRQDMKDISLKTQIAVLEMKSLMPGLKSLNKNDRLDMKKKV